MMIYLYSRLFFERQKQEFFEKFKVVASKERVVSACAQKLIDCSKKRKLDVLGKWFKLSYQ